MDLSTILKFAFILGQVFWSSSEYLGTKDSPEVARLREYLRTESSHPTPNYGEFFNTPWFKGVLILIQKPVLKQRHA